MTAMVLVEGNNGTKCNTFIASGFEMYEYEDVCWWKVMVGEVLFSIMLKLPV